MMMVKRSTAEIAATLRSEARFRPTIWGDARPLLIEAADEIERLNNALDAENDVLERVADRFRANQELANEIRAMKHDPVLS